MYTILVMKVKKTIVSYTRTHLIVYFGFVNDEATEALLLLFLPWVIVVLLLIVLLGINVLARRLLFLLAGLIALGTIITSLWRLRAGS